MAAVGTADVGGAAAAAPRLQRPTSPCSCSDLPPCTRATLLSSSLRHAGRVSAGLCASASTAHACKPSGAQTTRRPVTSNEAKEAGVQPHLQPLLGRPTTTTTTTTTTTAAAAAPPGGASRCFNVDRRPSFTSDHPGCRAGALPVLSPATVLPQQLARGSERLAGKHSVCVLEVAGRWISIQYSEAFSA